MLVACGDDGAPTLQQSETGTVCQPFSTAICACPVATGSQYCLGDGSGYAECQCPVQRFTTRAEEAVVPFSMSAASAESTDGRSLRVPMESGLGAAQSGDILVSFEGAGFLGRVSSMTSVGDGMVVETDPVTLEEAFEELEISIQHDAPIEVWLPEAIRNELAQDPDAMSSKLAGVDLSITGSVTPGISFGEGSRFDIDGPRFDAGMSFGRTGSIDIGLGDVPKYGLRSFKLIVDTGIDVRLETEISLEVDASATLSVELLEAALSAAGFEYLAPVSYPIGGGFEAFFYFYLECGVSVAGQATVQTFVDVSSDMTAGLRYNFDRNPKWRGVGDASINADAGLEDFDWSANGQLLCQIKPEVEVLLFRTAGPFVNAGPYFLTQGQAGRRYRIEIGGGFRGDVGGRINVLQLGTVWEESYELFDLYEEFYSIDFAVCGDGYLQVDEECDEGFLIDSPACNANCGCSDFYKPAPDTIAPNDASGGEWLDYNYEGRFNGCTPSCGDGVVQADRGEACDDGFENNGRGFGSCAADCSRRFCLCGDGVVDDEGGFAFELQNDRGEVLEVVTYDACAEKCEDGNTSSGDGCRADCLGVETCGDYFLDPGEECDLGDANGSGEGWCLADCRIDRGCGDGALSPRPGNAEQCDDGNDDNCDECHNDCTVNVDSCGDGYVCGSETCDSFGVNTTTCDADCSANECGDGFVNIVTESCDDGGDSPLCDSDCSPARCGDGRLNLAAGETCEPGGFFPGAPDPSASCDSDCTAAACGDGVVNEAAGEACDDGDRDNCTPACNDTCTGEWDSPAVCGDGVLECGEVCDDGNTEGCDGCSADCLRAEGVCGDGTTECDEVCDDGNTDPGDGCRADCEGVEECGDGLVDMASGDACDDGDTAVCGGPCLSDCSASRPDTCDGGTIDACEVCEDSDPSNTGVDDGCSASAPNCTACAQCQEDVCGDGITGPTETCDGVSFLDYCAGEGLRVNCTRGSDCTSGACLRGTGVCADAGGQGGSELPCTATDLSLCAPGEVCDSQFIDGECNATCDGLIACGDGVVEGAEACDDGNTLDCDGCTADCSRVDDVCGDGFTDFACGEECEPFCLGGSEDGAACFTAAQRDACPAGGGACNDCTLACLDP
ncbi:MAG: hypothetical protein AAF654_10875 [Myxococcota bacterium]